MRKIGKCKKLNLTIVVCVCLAVFSIAQADYITFNGSNSNPAAPVGIVENAAYWEGGVLPTGSSTGLVSVTGSGGASWGNGYISVMNLRQTGGYIDGTAANGFSTTSSIVYEIEDGRTSYSTYTNSLFNSFALLNTGSADIRLLNGVIIVSDTLTLNNSSKTLSIRNGLFTAASTKMKGRVNMLADGDGEVSFGTATSSIGVFNFETGNTGSITFDGFTAGSWNFITGQGRLLKDGVAVSDLADFEITNGGETIALIPEPTTIGLFGVAGISCLLFRRLNH